MVGCLQKTLFLKCGFESLSVKYLDRFDSLHTRATHDRHEAAIGVPVF
jgi:hypothetical protein